MATTNATQPTNRATEHETETGIAQTARDLAGGVAGAAGDVSARIPEVVQTTRDVVNEATSAVRRGSDPTLRLVGALSVGLSLGLLVGGAPRLIVLASLVPGALIGATLVERSDGATGSVTRRVQGA